MPISGGRRKHPDAWTLRLSAEKPDHAACRRIDAAVKDVDLLGLKVFPPIREVRTVLIEINRFLTAARLKELYEIPPSIWEKVRGLLPVKLVEGGEPYYLESEVDAFLASWLRHWDVTPAQASAPVDVFALAPWHPLLVPDVAKVLQVSKSKVYQLLDSGELQGPEGLPRRAYAWSVLQRLVPQEDDRQQDEARPHRPTAKANRKRRAGGWPDYYQQVMDEITDRE
jgi:hypothetical protein